MYQLIVQIMEKKVVIFLGHSQSAKSSALKDFTGDTSIICGKLGNGGSTTKTIKIYRSILSKLDDCYIFMDTIGLEDNTLKFTPQTIREEIELNILALSTTQKCDAIQGILITQSLRDSSHQIKNNLEFIAQIFGELPNRSVIVLGTKAHKVDEDQVQQRERAIWEIMGQYDIPQSQYIRFDTSYEKLPQSQIYIQQYKALEARLDKCSMINSNKSIKEKRDKINQIAKRIQKENTQVQKHPYQHTWTEQRWDGDVGKMLGKMKNKVFSQTRYHTTTHVPPDNYCYEQALKQYEQAVRKKLVMKNQL